MSPTKKQKLTEHQKLLLKPYRLSWQKKIILNHLLEGWWLETYPMDCVNEGWRGKLCWVRVCPVYLMMKEKYKDKYGPDYEPIGSKHEKQWPLEGISLHWHKQAWAGLEKQGYIAQLNGRWEVTDLGKEFMDAYKKWLDEVNRPKAST